MLVTSYQQLEASNNLFPMLKQYTLITLTLLMSVSIVAQNTVEDYVNVFSEAAVEQMHRTGIPASIFLAQGILESSFGNSQLAVQANNHFRLACNNDWDGEFFYQWKQSKRSQRPSCYRVYAHPDESFMEYANLLLKNDVFSSLVRLNSMNYKKWIKAIAMQGFSSKDDAEVQLKLVIENFQLAAFDNLPSQRSKRPIYQREIHVINGLKAIVVSSDESPLSIASEFNIPLRRILKFNDLKQGDSFQNNQFVYLELKRRRSKEKAQIHILNKNETLYDVAQMYGIKLKSLCELNRVNYSDKIATGEEIQLIYAATIPPRLENEKPRIRHRVDNPPGSDDIDVVDVPSDPLFEGLPTFEDKPSKPEKNKKVKPIQPYINVQPIEKPASEKPTVSDVVEEKPTPTDEQPAGDDASDESAEPPSKPDFNKKYDDDEVTNGYIEKPPYPIDKKEEDKDEEEILQPPKKGKINKEEKPKKELEGAPVPIIDANPTEEGMAEEEVSDAPPGGSKRKYLKDKKPSKPTKREGYHIVKKGQTLYRISKMYNISVAQLKKWNKLIGNNIEVGQELKVKE